MPKITKPDEDESNSSQQCVENIERNNENLCCDSCEHTFSDDEYSEDDDCPNCGDGTLQYS